MIPFNYHHLYYFYVIAQKGSIVEATKDLRLAQPTLSAQLKQFERFLNRPLFVRDKKRLVLTEEGHRVLAYAKMIFEIGQEMKDRVVDLSYKGSVRIQIGVPNFVPKTIVDQLLDFILKTDPKAFIVLKEDHLDHLVDHLRDHFLDLILTDVPMEGQVRGDFQNYLVGKIPVVFCAHPDVARKIRKFPRDLQEVPMILPAAPARLFLMIREYLIENNIDPHIVGEIQDVELVRRLVLKGAGVAPLNELTVKAAPAKGKLIILNPVKQTGLMENVYLIVRKRKMIHPLVEKIVKDFRIKGYSR